MENLVVRCMRGLIVESSEVSKGLLVGGNLFWKNGRGTFIHINRPNQGSFHY